MSLPRHSSCSDVVWGRLRRSRSWPICTRSRSANSVSSSSSSTCLDLDVSYGLHRNSMMLDENSRVTHFWALLCSHTQCLWSSVLHDVAVVYIFSHRPPYRLKKVHIHAFCHLVLLLVSIAFALINLRGVLLPVLMAAGIAVLLEPVIFLLIDPWVRCFRERPRIQGFFSDSLQFIGIEIGSSEPSSPNQSRTCSHVCGSERAISSLLRRVWCVLAVTLTVGGLLSLISSIGAWTFTSIRDVDWEKYLKGERVAWFQNHLTGFGFNDLETVFRELAVLIVQELGVKIIDSTMGALTGFLLMILFLGFFLIDSASERSIGKEPWRPVQRKIMKQVAHRVRGSDDGPAESVLWIQDDLVPLAATLLGRLRLQMRMYIRQKCHLSVLKAFLIGVVFALLDVDLWVIWTLLTFVLNFVPLGSALSTFAPVPFVFFDPSKDFLMVAICICWPILVHNIVGNIVEPRVFASSLNLHPITVLLALTFWTALWGITGALVCVPLTAMIRVALTEARSHPYAAAALALIEGVIASPGNSSETLDQISLMVSQDWRNTHDVQPGATQRNGTHSKRPPDGTVDK